MNVRTGLIAAAVIALCAPPVQAAPRPKPKPPCNLVTDAKADAYVVRSLAGATVPDDALDIVSADIATNASTVTVVIRVVKYTVPPTTSPTGSTYEMQFNVTGSGDLFYLNASNSPGAGATYDGGYREALPTVTTIAHSLGTPTGTFDTAKGEIRISAPLSMFSSRVKFTKGGKVTGIQVFTGRGGAGRGLFADEATAAKTYPIGTATCVAVGK